MAVYFHANFNLNRDRMSGILYNLIERPQLSDNEIAEQFGYRAPFTNRYKSWLKKCGIIENSIKVNLTEFGKVIYKEDLKLQKEPTLWFMHSFLTSSEDNAEAWHYFYHTYLPKNKIFTRPELSNAISMKLMAHNPAHFGKNRPMIKVITKVLIDSYISENAFGPLGVIELKDGVFHRGNAKIPHKWSNTETFSSLY